MLPGCLICKLARQEGQVGHALQSVGNAVVVEHPLGLRTAPFLRVPGCMVGRLTDQVLQGLLRRDRHARNVSAVLVDGFRHPIKMLHVPPCLLRRVAISVIRSYRFTTTAT